MKLSDCCARGSGSEGRQTMGNVDWMRFETSCMASDEDPAQVKEGLSLWYLRAMGPSVPFAYKRSFE